MLYYPARFSSFSVGWSLDRASTLREIIAVPFFSPAQTTAPAAPGLYSAVVPSPFARQLGSVFYIPAATGLQLRVTTRRCFDLARQLASWDYSCVILLCTKNCLLQPRSLAIHFPRQILTPLSVHALQTPYPEPRSFSLPPELHLLCPVRLLLALFCASKILYRSKETLSVARYAYSLLNQASGLRRPSAILVSVTIFAVPRCPFIKYLIVRGDALSTRLIRTSTPTCNFTIVPILPSGCLITSSIVNTSSAFSAMRPWY
ncbi:hypothetical protein C8J57DRAFT_1728442 [Mycena rebaudengoi]|nr:hypothetical protein C8J57DRAFT_1728442 [Mycena rebaudengoi]